MIHLSISDYAMFIEKKENKEIQTVNEKIVNIKYSVEDDEIGFQFINEYNTTNQARSNIIKTEKKIVKLKYKRRKLNIRINTWKRLKKLLELKLQKVQGKIDVIEKKGLIDRKYKPIRYTDLLNKGDLNSNDNNNTGDRNSIYYNPATKGNTKTLIFGMYRFIGVAGTGTIPFLITEKFSTIFLYYLTLIATAIYRSLKRYTTVRQKTRTIYLATRERKLQLMKQMQDYIAAAKTRPSISELLNTEPVPVESVQEIISEVEKVE